MVLCQINEGELWPIIDIWAPGCARDPRIVGVEKGLDHRIGTHDFTIYRPVFKVQERQPDRQRLFCGEGIEGEAAEYGLEAAAKNLRAVDLISFVHSARGSNSRVQRLKVWHTCQDVQSHLGGETLYA